MKRLLVAIAIAATANAQAKPELRVDFAVADTNRRVEAGFGASVPMGAYVRGSVTGAFDVWTSSSKANGRVEGLVRFLLDPVAEHPWGVSAGGGLGYRERPYLALAFDVEGPRMGYFRPAVQLAFGGGTRVAMVLRGTRRFRR